MYHSTSLSFNQSVRKKKTGRLPYSQLNQDFKWSRSSGQVYVGERFASPGEKDELWQLIEETPRLIDGAI